MSVTANKSGMKWFAVLLFRGSLMGLFSLLVVGLPGTALRAGTVRIKLVNGKNGHPLAGTCVNVWVGNERKEAMAIPTDKDGVAWLRLTDERGDVNTQNQWKGCGLFGVINPVVRYADSIRVNAGYVSCQPRTPDYSWLAMVNFSTKKVLESGIVTANACGKAEASPEPGEIVLFVRPLSWWERLKQ